MADSRYAAIKNYVIHKTPLEKVKWPLEKKLTLFLLSIAIAVLVAFVLFDATKYPVEARAIFIITFSACLWITEAIPPFAVSFVILGGAIFFLEDPLPLHPNKDWGTYAKLWGSSIMWLFLGGFVLAKGAEKTGFDRFFSKLVISRFGTKPANVLLGIMLTTGILSMFISNTATAVMMLSVVGPITAKMEMGSKFRKALMLGIAVSATVGGMGTIIGTAPNAIAVATINEIAKTNSNISPVSFLDWMKIGMPIAFGLLFLSWFLLLKLFPPVSNKLEIDWSDGANSGSKRNFWIVSGIFAFTVTLWMTSGFHGVSVSLVAFVPIILMTMTGILDSDDFKNLSWDTLALIMGGLILGSIIKNNDLTSILLKGFDFNSQPILVLVIVGFTTTALSNLMSNTAAAGIVIPLITSIMVNVPVQAAVVIGLACSTAMFLPISTPPNAIVFSTGELQQKDFRLLGVVVAVVGIAAIVAVTFTLF